MRRLPFIALLAAYLGVVLWLTLRAGPGSSSPAYFVPFVDTWSQIRDTGDHSALGEVVGNILLFIPLGYLLPAALRPLRRINATVLAGLAITISIELLQWLLIEGRSPSIDDVIYNTIGTGIGATLYVLLAGLWRFKRAHARKEQPGSGVS